MLSFPLISSLKGCIDGRWVQTGSGGFRLDAIPLTGLDRAGILDGMRQQGFSMSRKISQSRESRPANKTSQKLSRLEAASSPWWASLPAVAVNCVKIAVFPAKAVAQAADAVVSLAFVALGGTAVMWWFGWISDASVAGFLGKLGERALGIVRSSGLI